MTGPVKPHILLLSTNSDEAGAPLHVETLVHHLSKHVNFTLLFGEDGPVFQRLKAAAFDVDILPGMRSDIRPGRDLRLIRRLTKMIREIGPDLIHCHSSKAGLLGRLSGHWCEVPVLFTIHGWSWNSLGGRSAKLALLVERLIARLNGVHFLYVCEAAEVTGKKILGLRSEQGTVIYNGVNDLSVSPERPENPVIFIMPARAAYPKDHETLVRAFETMSGDIRLHLCGEGTETNEFQARVLQWAPTRYAKISCLGNRNDIPDLLHRAHVMVLSSQSEAMPLSIVEAMSAGLPIIATKVGGIPEIVTPGENGYLAPPRDHKSLARAMTELLDPTRRAEMGIYSRKRYERDFTSTRMAQSTLNYYLKLTGRTS